MALLFEICRMQFPALWCKYTLFSQTMQISNDIFPYHYSTYLIFKSHQPQIHTWL